MPAVLIDSLDALLIHSGKVLEGEATWDEVELLPRAIVVPVVTNGQGWDKRIDARGARLIQSLQSQADRIYANFPEALPAKAPHIKVEAKEGSNGLEFDLTQVIIALINRCPPETISMVIYALIAGGLGLGGLFLYWRHRENTQDKRLIEKAMEFNKAVVSEALGTTKDLAAPIKEYVASLRKEDTISVAGTTPVTAPEAKKALRRRREAQPVHHVSGDGRYHLMALALRQHPPVLILEQGGEKLDALLQRLDHRTRTSLVQQVEAAMAEQALPRTIDLQLDVYFSPRKIKYGAVIGIGAPREGLRHYRLGEIPGQVQLADLRNEPDDEEEAGPDDEPDSDVSPGM